MNTTAALAEHLITCFEGTNWTEVSIADTVKDVSWQQAQQQTAASKNTIASLVHHLFYWNGILMQRADGNNPSIPEANGYDVNRFYHENDWFALMEKTRASFTELAEKIRMFPEEKLSDTYAEGKPSYYKSFQGIIEHAYYHLGQIVIIKKLIKTIQSH